MFFNCSKCGLVISCPEIDYIQFEKRGLECPHCYTIISSGRYPKNLKGEITLFSPFGEGLGDNIVGTNIKKKYLLDNPDEYVFFAHSWHDFRFFYVTKNPKKIFISSLPGKFNEIVGKNVYKYILPVESKNIAKDWVIYPELLVKPIKSKYFDCADQYVVVHLRNVEKVKSKNVNPSLVEKILDYLTFSIGLQVVFVGNDMPLNIGESAFGKDFRSKLSLAEIEHVLSRALLFVGRDSGIAHVAAAVNCPSVVWGYNSANWIPATRGKFESLLRRESTFENIADRINKILGISPEGIPCHS